MKRTQQRPSRISWMKFYVLWPIKDVAEIVYDYFNELYIRIVGGWYCEYCQKVHGRRVFRYTIEYPPNGPITTSPGPLMDDPALLPNRPLVCSLGRDAIHNKEWVPTPSYADLMRGIFKPFK